MDGEGKCPGLRRADAYGPCPAYLSAMRRKIGADAGLYRRKLRSASQKEDAGAGNFSGGRERNGNRR